MSKIKQDNVCNTCHKPKKVEEMRKCGYQCKECYNRKYKSKESKPEPLFGGHFDNQPFGWVY